MARNCGSNLAKVKLQNTRLIKEILYKYAPISRSEIAGMLSLTPPTITSNIAEMLSAGYVEELSDDPGRGEGTLGRKPVSLNLVADASYFVGVEVTPDRLYCCVTDLRGNVLRSFRAREEFASYASSVSAIARAVEELLAGCGVDRKKLLGVGVGVPGFVSGSRGVIRNLRRFGWKDKPMAADLSAAVDLPVCVENNTRARAIWEDMMSKDVRPDSFAYFYVSKGIACPMIAKNRFFFGTPTGAGEVGHCVVQVDGPKCPSCGNYGCLEAYSSDTAVVGRCAELLSGNRDTLLRELAADPARPTLDEILMAQERGDGPVCAVLATAINYLAVTLANIINFASPDLVIVDAYLMKRPENRRQLLETLRINSYVRQDEEVAVEFMQYDELKGCKGAAAVAIQKFFIGGG